MRVVAAGDTYWKFEKMKQYLSELGKGIILFANSSLADNKHPQQDWTIKDIARYTRKLPMTVVGGKDDRIHIIKNGTITKAQLDGFAAIKQQSEYRAADKLHNVSYVPGKKILALSRIAVDATTPYEGKGKADLLLIAGCLDDCTLEEILKAHEKSLKPNALIVSCEMHFGEKYIYSLSAGKIVDKILRGEQRNKYIAFHF